MPVDHEPVPPSHTPVVFDSGPRSAPVARPSRASLRHVVAFGTLPILALGAAVLAGAAPTGGAASIFDEINYLDEIDGLEPDAVCPEGMAFVAQGKVRVCVDRWEASLVEIGPSGEERPHSPYLSPHTATGARIKAVSRPGVVPQAYVSKYQAEIACRAASKRLCRSEEWTAACEGPSRTLWPYGPREDARACNTHGRNPLAIRYGGLSRVKYGVGMQDPILNQYAGTVAKTGSFAKCTNDYGVYDMVGNLHEWTADATGTFRGGYYQDATKNMPGCRYHTTAHAPTYHDYSTGFRCCADPG